MTIQEKCAQDNWKLISLHRNYRKHKHRERDRNKLRSKTVIQYDLIYLETLKLKLNEIIEKNMRLYAIVIRLVRCKL